VQIIYFKPEPFQQLSLRTDIITVKSDTDPTLTLPASPAAYNYTNAPERCNAEDLEHAHATGSRKISRSILTVSFKNQYTKIETQNLVVWKCRNSSLFKQYIYIISYSRWYLRYVRSRFYTVCICTTAANVTNSNDESTTMLPSHRESYAHDRTVRPFGLDVFQHFCQVFDVGRRVRAGSLSKHSRMLMPANVIQLNIRDNEVATVTSIGQ